MPSPLEYVKPVHRNLLESGRGQSGTILELLIFVKKFEFYLVTQSLLSKISTKNQSNRQFIDTLLLSKIFLQILIQQRTPSLHLLVPCSCPRVSLPCTNFSEGSFMQSQNKSKERISCSHCCHENWRSHIGKTTGGRIYGLL